MNIEGKTISKVRKPTQEEVKDKGFLYSSDCKVLEFTDGTKILFGAEETPINSWEIIK